MSKIVWHKHPFRLLLYLEWILLGIILLTLLSFLFHPRPFGGAVSHREFRFLFDFAALCSLIILGMIGYKMPFGVSLFAKVYIAICLILSWLIVLLVGRGDRLFPPLLLIVVIRACVLLSPKDRVITAILAYGSFIGVQIMAWWQVRPLGVSLGRPLPRLLKHLPKEEFSGILGGLLLNSALLFGLVLAFVMLLVGAVLAAAESKQKLVLANNRLRQYALKIENQATLEERNRIAREIHDSVGHYLTAQSIQLENVAHFFRENPDKAAAHLIKARQLGKEALQNVRQSVATLRQKSLQSSNLKANLAQLIQEFQATTEITINYFVEIRSAISEEITLTIYRLVQEALTNIAKHSQANQVNLYLETNPKRVYLTIEDNGIGFEPEANTTGFGLQGMRERVAAINGDFSLISKPGAGCKIQVEIKLPIND
jgi:signal transduction histidine kinase